MERNRRPAQKKEGTAFFVISRIRYRTQFGLIFDEKCDSEHPKTQQRDRKIGQTIGSPMRISAVQLVLFTKGMEARIRKKQEERSRLWGTFGESWGASGDPLGRLGEALGRLWEPWGRLWGDFGRLLGGCWEDFGTLRGDFGETLGGFGETLGDFGKAL